MGLPHSHRISRARWYSGSTVDRKRVPRTGLSPSLVDLSRSFRYAFSVRILCPNPVRISTYGLGSYPFARHYLGNRCFTFSSFGYLDVSVPRVPLRTLCIHVRISSHYGWWVPSFGDLRVKAHLQLTAAFRSLSRPSSAPSAKASTLRSSSLNRIVLI